MYRAQFAFGYDNCEMYYLVEGNIDAARNTNLTIGRSHDLTKEHVEAEIDSLAKEGFKIIRSSCQEDSMFKIAKLALEVMEKLKSKELTAQYR